MSAAGSPKARRAAGSPRARRASRAREQARAREEPKARDEEDLLKCFQAFDADQDGAISRDELCTVLQELDETAWSDETLNALMKKFDKNNDGRIDYFEFVEWISKSPKDVNWTDVKPGIAAETQAESAGSGPSPGSEDWCRWRFRRWDLLGSGYITFGEFGYMLGKYYPLGLPMEDLREVFDFVSSGCKVSSKRHEPSSSTAKITADTFVKWIVRYKGKGCYSVAQGTVSIPLKSHISFVLGGHAGDQVILSRCSEVRKGWRVISFTANGHRIRGDNVGPMLQIAIEQDQPDIVVEFDVEDLVAWKKRSVQMSRTKLSEQQEGAFVELTAMLESEFGIPCVSDSSGLRPDMEALTTLPPDLKANMLQNSALMRYIVGAKAVHEFDALLGKRAPEELQLATKLLKSISDNDVDSAKACVGAGADLMLLDGHGNVPVHHARSAGMAVMLARAMPRALQVRNQHGQAPLQTVGARLPLEVGTAELLIDGKLHNLLALDKDGVSAFMQMQGDARRHFESQLSSWEEMERALHLPSPIARLEALKPEGHWQELLAFHIFGEPSVWAKGLHTDQSRARLATVWGVVSDFFEILDGRTPGEDCPAALKAAKVLLQATRGPRVMQDPRSPYRNDLSRAMARLARQSDAILNSFHGGLSGEDAEWLRNLENWVSSDLALDPLVDLGVEVPQRPRMDFRLADRRDGLELPRWATEQDVDFAEVFADLERVGAVERGESGCPNDTAYQFLHLAFDERGVDDLQHEAGVARCFAGWLRGVCQQNQVRIRDSVSSAVARIDVDLDQNFHARSEAKGILRICEKSAEEISDILHQLQAKGLALNRDIRRVLRRSAAVVCDMNGCTLVLETPEQLKLAYELLVVLKPLKVKNRFNEYSSGYMDVKLLVPVVTADGPLVTEIQLLFANAYAEKSFMHLPYEYYRGSLDWPHVACTLQPPSDGAIGRCPEGHELKALGPTPSRPWLCDGMGESAACKSALDRFRCDACDYDLCTTCYERETVREEFNCPEGHRLEALGRVELRDWICDGRHKAGGCKTTMNFEWAANRFCCQECDYDLCQMCLLAQLEASG